MKAKYLMQKQNLWYVLQFLGILEERVHGKFLVEFCLLCCISAVGDLNCKPDVIFMKTVVELWFLSNPCPWAAQIPERANYWLFVSTRVKYAVLSNAVPISFIYLFQMTTPEPS